ncbi:MAG: stage II sporulation protein D [Salibacteraceae bacterium]|jgi:stage II sporulation protein D
MFKNLIFSFLLINTLSGFSQQRDHLVLGLFWNERPETIIVSIRGGEYKLIADNTLEIPFRTNDMFHISTDGDKVRVKNLSQTFGSFSKIEIIEVNDTSSLNIKSSKPKLANRVYEDNFRIYSSESRLKILNDANLANYVAGVVQWESGNGNSLTYYKVQAIITRTYALKNINKYESKGFNLCDRVDSQVYKGRTKNKTILQAVKETKDLVLVDQSMNLISAVFHSNSGGKTRNSEDVWSQRLPYLRAVKDTFSIGKPHYAWEKSMPTEKWLRILKTNFNVDTDNEKIRKYFTSYCPSKPQNYMLSKNNVKLTSVRSVFKLRSTDFCVTESGNQIKIKGKGFGHGVGLSQEGAMKMSLTGYSFEDILGFYYKNVHLVNMKTMDLLESEN